MVYGNEAENKAAVITLVIDHKKKQVDNIINWRLELSYDDATVPVTLLWTRPNFSDLGVQLYTELSEHLATEVGRDATPPDLFIAPVQDESLLPVGGEHRGPKPVVAVDQILYVTFWQPERLTDITYSTATEEAKVDPVNIPLRLPMRVTSVERLTFDRHPSSASTAQYVGMPSLVFRTIPATAEGVSTDSTSTN